MTNFDLLSAVQPADGWFAICGLKNGMRQELVETREEADQVVANYLAQERDVYFGVAKYKTATGRSKENVASLRAFWLDLDCGEAKAEINKKTSKPNGYIDQQTALLDLQRFCKTTGLPKPIIVNSGRGIHVYWPLTEDISREEWEFVASKLHTLCIAHDLYADAAVFEVARILRVPGTLNFKDNPPTTVEVISTGRPVSLDAFKGILGIADAPKPAPAKRGLTELGKLMQNNMVSSFKKIMQRSIKGEGCEQILDGYQNRATISEPRWFDILSIAKFCEDADTAIHKVSAGHEDYNPATTVAKIQHIVGPHTCDVFARNNPSGCDNCPLKGKIKSPIVIGRMIAEAPEQEEIITIESEVEGIAPRKYHVPKYPEPYFRGANGGIYRQPLGEEEEALFVYQHDLYVLKRMEDPSLGDVVVMRIHMPKDGIREFTVPHTKLADRTELKKFLSSKGVVCADKRFGLILDYIYTAINELQYKQKAEMMRSQFGWADNDSKFIIGDREITKDGTFHSPPSKVTSKIAPHMVPTGSYEKWKEVFELYGRPGLEPHAFAALTAFGAPLFKFTGQMGAIINVIHPSSGTGKTTILHMTNSVWGAPDRLCGLQEDTFNAKTIRLGVMNNLPFVIDEMTNMKPQDFSTLIYNASQGRGKDRVMASSNELRDNLTSWQTITLASSNASFYEKLTLLKDNPDGERMRLLEYKIDYSDAIEVDHAKHMFDHQLKHNFGWAGDIYATFLVNNLEEARDGVLSIQAKIDRELKLTQRERFWSASIASNIAGGLLAKRLGIIDWDMKRIYMWACNTMLKGIREEVQPPEYDITSVIGDYINRNMQNILVVNDLADRRAQMPSFPIMEPRGELRIRWEPDTKKMFLLAKAFKDDCISMQINYKETIKKLQEKGIYKRTTTKRLSKGMKVVSLLVYCIELDCSSDDFINLDEYIRPEDGSREG